MSDAWGDHEPGGVDNCPVCNPSGCDCNRCAPGGDYRGPATAIVLLLVCAALLVGLLLAARGWWWT